FAVIVSTSQARAVPSGTISRRQGTAGRSSVERFSAHVTLRLDLTQCDDRPLQNGKRRCVLVVMEHQVERAGDILALELDVKGKIDELGFAFDLAGYDTAPRRSRLVAGTRREVGVLRANGLTVAFHFLGPLS